MCYFGPFSGNCGERLRSWRTLPFGASLKPRPIRCATAKSFVTLTNRQATRFASHTQCLTNLRGKMRIAPTLVDRLVHRQRFREARAVEPRQAVPHFPPRVLNRDGKPMVGARPAERDQVSAGLGNPQGFRPELDAGDAVVPFFTHKRQAVGRVADDRVHAVVGQGPHDVAAVAMLHLPVVGHSLSVAATSSTRIVDGASGLSPEVTSMGMSFVASG